MDFDDQPPLVLDPPRAVASVPVVYYTASIITLDGSDTIV
jgi:hypothetical protein